jgi:hypothetical protein
MDQRMQNSDIIMYMYLRDDDNIRSKASVEMSFVKYQQFSKSDN